MYDKNDKNQYTSIHTHHTNTHTHTKTTVKKYIFIIYVKYCAVFHDEKLKYWLFINKPIAINVSILILYSSKKHIQHVTTP